MKHLFLALAIFTTAASAGNFGNSPRPLHNTPLHNKPLHNGGSTNAPDIADEAGSEDVEDINEIKDEEQYADCYNTTGLSGSSLHIDENMDQLDDYGFDNMVSSCCFYGVWMLYDAVTYNRYDTTASSYMAWGENYCMDVDTTFDSLASSIRYVGTLDGYKNSTINFFEDDYFRGEAEMYNEDAYHITWDDFGQSIVVTGCDPWTIYEEMNYEGNSSCVFPSDMTNCYPGFYSSSDTLDGFGGEISSTKLGCFSDHNLYPESAETFDQGEDATGQSMLYN